MVQYVKYVHGKTRSSCVNLVLARDGNKFRMVNKIQT